jgi:hypothetical protein
MSQVKISNKSPLKATLTSKGLGNLPRAQTEQDFDLVVGNHHHRCPWFVAEFLSPKLCSHRSADPTFNEMRIETIDKDNLFCHFVSLGSGHDIIITEANYSFFVSICRELHNGELYFTLINRFEGNPTISNVFDRLSHRELLFDLNCSSVAEINFLASHFHELNDSLLSSLSVEMLHSILSNDLLQVKSEDDLYRLIIVRRCEDIHYSLLLECIRFEFLSVSSIEHFISSEINSFILLNRSICD